MTRATSGAPVVLARGLGFWLAMLVLLIAPACVVAALQSALKPQSDDDAR